MWTAEEKHLYEISTSVKSSQQRGTNSPDMLSLYHDKKLLENTTTVDTDVVSCGLVCRVRPAAASDGKVRPESDRQHMLMHFHR